MTGLSEVNACLSVSTIRRESESEKKTEACTPSQQRTRGTNEPRAMTMPPTVAEMQHVAIAQNTATRFADDTSPAPIALPIRVDEATLTPRGSMNCRCVRQQSQADVSK
jgi:hypothetical protein